MWSSSDFPKFLVDFTHNEFFKNPSLNRNFHHHSSKQYAGYIQIVEIESAAVIIIRNFQIKIKRRLYLRKILEVNPKLILLNCEKALSECFLVDFIAEHLSHFKFSPITSVDSDKISRCRQNI